MEGAGSIHANVHSAYKIHSNKSKRKSPRTTHPYINRFEQEPPSPLTGHRINYAPVLEHN